MAGLRPGDRGATRGGTAVERYVRELLRDAERMRRSSRPRSAPTQWMLRIGHPIKPPLRPSPESATDDHPRVA